MFPVIILSTITGAANFAMDSVISNPEQKTYAQMGLGCLSIATGIISTIANRLGYANGMEAHHGAAQSWGKFKRLISIELALHPNERNDCMQFLTSCRTEFDRLIEQSPSIPESVIAACKLEFEKYPKVRKPEIVGDIDTTHVYVDTDSRLRKIAQEAAITIAQKKGVLKQIVLDDLAPRINQVLETTAIPAIKADLKKEIARAAREAAHPPPPPPDAGGTGVDFAKRQVEERKEEMQKLAMSGLVSELRERLEIAKRKSITAPPGIGGVEAQEVVIHVQDDDEYTDELPDQKELPGTVPEIVEKS